MPAEAPRDYTLDPCFLGPYGKNDTLLEKLLVEFLRDHVHWRRNCRLEDPPAIAASAARHRDYLAFESRMRRQLHDGSEDSLLILRHTLMNPYLIDHESGISYIDRYFDHLGRRLRALAGTR